MQKLIDMSWQNPKCKLEGLLGVCGKEATITDEEFSYYGSKHKPRHELWVPVMPK
jgi:hypothetical protein